MKTNIFSRENIEQIYSMLIIIGMTVLGCILGGQLGSWLFPTTHWLQILTTVKGAALFSAFAMISPLIYNDIFKDLTNSERLLGLIITFFAAYLNFLAMVGMFILIVILVITFLIDFGMTKDWAEFLGGIIGVITIFSCPMPLAIVNRLLENYLKKKNVQ
jgi:hypothetical protein